MFSMFGITPGLVKGSGGSGGGNTYVVPDSDTQALFNAMSVKPSYSQSQDYYTLITGLKTDGVWSLLDVLQIYVAHDQQAARVDIRNPARLATENNSPTWAVNTGYTFDGVTSYLSAGYTPSTDAVNVTTSTGFIGTYQRNNISSNGISAGANSGGNPNRYALRPRSTSSNPAGSIMSTLTSSALGTMTNSQGLITHNRTAGVFTFYRNGSVFDTVTPASTIGTLPPYPIFVGGENGTGSFSGPAAFNVGALVLGAGLNDTQHLALYNRIQTYMTARGANV